MLRVALHQTLAALMLMTPVLAASPAEERGKSFALANCARCHSVDRVTQSPLKIAPPFLAHLTNPSMHPLVAGSVRTRSDARAGYCRRAIPPTRCLRGEWGEPHARRAKYRVCRPFSAGDRVKPCRLPGDPSGPTPEIAGLQEKYNTGAVDQASSMHPGRPRQTLKQMPNPDRSFRGGSGPMAQNSNVAIPEISQ